MKKVNNSKLLKNTIDSSLDMIQVFEAVRDEQGQIIDFIWILINIKSKEYFGDVLGESLLTKQPGVVKKGIFDTFKKVVETAEPNLTIHHYVHEQFNGWFQLSTVKQGDGVATTTKDVTEMMVAKNELEQRKQLLQNITDATNLGIIVFRAIRNKEGKISDFVRDYCNRTSKDILGTDITGSLLSDPKIGSTAEFGSLVTVLESGKINTYTCDFQRGGVQNWFNVTNTLLDKDCIVHTWHDITAKKIADDAVRNVNQSLQATLDSSLYFIQAFKSVRDPSGNIIDFIWLFTNQTWNEHNRHMIGASVLEEKPEVLDNGLFEKFVQVTETGIPIDHEQLYSHEKFADQWFHQTIVKLGDGLVINTENITPRKSTELKMLTLKDEIAKKAEDKYCTLFNTITEGLAVLEMLYDNDGHPFDMVWTEINPAFRQMIGGANIVGKTCSQFNPFQIYSIESYHQILRTGNPQHKETYDPVSQRWYLTHTSRVGTSGSRMIVKIFDDITKRKNAEIALRESERKYRMLFESIDEGFALMELLRDKQGKVIDLIYREVNDAFKRFTGWHDAVGKKGSTLMHNFDQSLLDNMQGVADSNKPYRKEDYVADLDRWYDVHYSCTGIPGDKCIIAVFKDTTDRKRHMQQKELVVRLSDKIRPLNSQVAVIEAFCQEVGSYFKVARCGYAEVDASENRFVIRMDWTNSETKSLRGSWLFSQVDTQSLSKYLKGNVIFSAGTAAEVASHDIVAAMESPLNILSTLSVQVMKGEEWSASFYVHDKKCRAWSAAEINFMEELAGRLWSAVKRTKIEQDLVRAQVAYRIQLEEEVRERTYELHESRDQLRSILDTTLVQMSILEAVRGLDNEILDFEIKATNNELEKETGRNDLVGKLYAKEYPGIIETGLFDLIIKTVETGMSQSKEYFYSYDGFNKWFNCMFVKLGDGVVATNMDITARKSAEEDRYRNYLLLQQSEEIALMGSWDYDLQTKEFSCSDGMYRLFDLDRTTKITPDTYLTYTTTQSRPAAENVVRKILHSTGDFEETLELIIGNVLKVFRIKAMVIYNSQGKAERILGIDLDISAMRHAEDKLRKMEAEKQMEIFRVSLSTVEEERYRISESLHNGIAQILYGIKINLGSLSQRMEPDEFVSSKSYVNKLLTEVISETRRISHELMPTTLEEFGLKSAIDDICQQFSNFISFDCRTSGLHQRLEKYMELAIYRTAQEIISNVVKHAKATRCTVKIDVREDEVLIRIDDNGAGIDASPKRKPGIGLAAIRSKIKLLNGDIRIDSAVGKGTKVAVRIPYVTQSSPRRL